MNTNLILELILDYVTGYSFLNLSSSCKYLNHLIQSKAKKESNDLIESYGSFLSPLRLLVHLDKLTPFADIWIHHQTYFWKPNSDSVYYHYFSFVCKYNTHLTFHTQIWPDRHYNVRSCLFKTTIKKGKIIGYFYPHLNPSFSFGKNNDSENTIELIPSMLYNGYFKLNGNYLLEFYFQNKSYSPDEKMRVDIFYILNRYTTLKLLSQPFRLH